MFATLKFLSRVTNEIFESQMKRAALSERQHFFGRRAP
jgi:hypothetical protein